MRLCGAESAATTVSIHRSARHIFPVLLEVLPFASALRPTVAPCPARLICGTGPPMRPVALYSRPVLPPRALRVHPVPAASRAPARAAPPVSARARRPRAVQSRRNHTLPSACMRRAIEYPEYPRRACAGVPARWGDSLTAAGVRRPAGVRRAHPQEHARREVASMRSAASARARSSESCDLLRAAAQQHTTAQRSSRVRRRVPSFWSVRQDTLGQPSAWAFMQVGLRCCATLAFA